VVQVFVADNLGGLAYFQSPAVTSTNFTITTSYQLNMGAGNSKPEELYQHVFTPYESQ